MGIQVKKNQALTFTDVNAAPGALDSCGCNNDYCQPVQTNDIINIQGTVGTVNSTNLSVLANYNFGTGWSNDAGKIVGDGVPTDTIQTISNALGLTPGNRYEIIIDATSKKFQQFSGGVQFTAPNLIYYGNTDYELNAGDVITVSGTSSNNGTFTVVSVVYSVGTAITVVESVTTELALAAVIDMPYKYEPISDKGYRFKFNGAYLPLPVVAPDTGNGFTMQAYLMRWMVNVTSVTDDRIRIECSDSDIIVVINSISIKAVSRVGAALYSGGSVVVSQDAPTGITYYPENEYKSNTDGTAALTTLAMLWKYRIDFSNLFGLTLKGCYQISVYDSFGEVDDDRKNVSNCMEIRASHDCTLVFNAANNDNAFGFDYSDTTFQHFLRVKAKMDVTAYPEEAETPYIFSNNNRVLMFARRDKEYTVFVTDAPDHIHDCLSHMRLHDRFAIGTNIFTDLVEYVKESGYELDRRKTSRKKQATFTVREKQGLASNFPCS